MAGEARRVWRVCGGGLRRRREREGMAKNTGRGTVKDSYGTKGRRAGSNDK